jgi:hypothetical protein
MIGESKDYREKTDAKGRTSISITMPRSIRVQSTKTEASISEVQNKIDTQILDSPSHL